MSRSRVFMNEPKPSDPAERRQWERFSRMAGERTLDGTNLAWIYDRQKEPIKTNGGNNKNVSDAARRTSRVGQAKL